MRIRTRLLGASVLAALVTVVAVAAWPAGGATVGHVERVTITILPSSNTHADAMAVPASVAIAPGVLVELTLVNRTPNFHTFTVPGLHVNAMAKPGRTTVSFRAERWGTFTWYCVLCQKGMHGHAHHMSGKVYAIIDPNTIR